MKFSLHIYEVKANSFVSLKENRNKISSIYIVSLPRSGTSFLCNILNDTLKNKNNIINDSGYRYENNFQNFGEYFAFHLYLMFLNKDHDIFDYLIDRFKILPNKHFDKNKKKIWFDKHFAPEFFDKEVEAIYGRKVNCYRAIRNLVLKEFFRSEDHKKKSFLQYEYFPKYTKVFSYQLSLWGMKYKDFFDIIKQNHENEPKFIFVSRDIYDITSSHIVKNKTGINSVTQHSFSSYNQSMSQKISVSEKEMIKAFNDCNKKLLELQKFRDKIASSGFSWIQIEFESLIKDPIKCIDKIVKSLDIDSKLLFDKEYISQRTRVNKATYIPTKRKENEIIVKRLKSIPYNNFDKI